MTELLGDEERSLSLLQDGQQEENYLPITKEETRRSSNTPGSDNLPTEILKLIDEDNLKVLECMFNEIYRTGIYPEEWLSKNNPHQNINTTNVKEKPSLDLRKVMPHEKQIETTSSNTKLSRL